MSFIAKDTGGGGDFKLVPEGTHMAVCNMVVDLGHQETEWKGVSTVKHQCYIRWELPHERMEWTDKDGKVQEGPMVIGRTYTVSLSEKANLRKDLEAWRGKGFTPQELEGFDLFKLLGVGCQVTITHTTNTSARTYANVIGLAGWPKGVDRPRKTECPILKYSTDEPQDFGELSEWLREKIMAQKDPETVYQTEAEQRDVDLDDEIPF